MSDAPSLSETLKRHFTGACLAPNPKGTGPKVLGGEMGSPAAENTPELRRQQRVLDAGYKYTVPWGASPELVINGLKPDLKDCANPAPKTSGLEMGGP